MSACYKVSGLSSGGCQGGFRMSKVAACVLGLLVVVVMVVVGVVVHIVGRQTDTPVTRSCSQKAQPCIPQVAEQRIYQLPKTVTPIYYDLEMRPEFYTNNPNAFTFSGHIKITIQCLRVSSNVTLHSRELDITSGSIEFGPVDSSTSDVSYKSHEFDVANNQLTFYLSRDMEQGHFYYLRMNFSGILKNDMQGFYVTYYTRNNTIMYLAMTQFAPMSARKAFPCFDEPALKAHFNITVVRKEHLSSASNMKKLGSENRDTGYVADIYQSTPRMSTYLVAFLVSDFTYIQKDTHTGLEYRIWAPNDSLSNLDFAMETGMKSISMYEKYFSIPFPLPKQAMAAIPEMAFEAMENWGLITYQARRLYYIPEVTPFKEKLNVFYVITHELAHQWFGNLLTMKWWDDVWLNEGFATFFMFLSGEFIEPVYDSYNMFAIWRMLPAMEIDAFIHSHPVYFDATRKEEFAHLYDSIAYDKGGSLLRMLKFFIGDGTFQKGLTSYLKSHAYDSATHEDLFNALSQQAQEDNATSVDVMAVMKPWLLQMNYPVVTVIRVSSHKVRLRQERFLLGPSENGCSQYRSPYSYTWTIPFTMTTSTERNFNVTQTDIVWLKRRSEIHHSTSAIPDPRDGFSWILGNINLHGFYRVNYEEENWKSISRQLKLDHKVISAINRAQILNDALDLVRVGMLDMRTGLETLEYLQSETSYYPWHVVSSKLRYYNKLLSGSDIYAAFQRFIRNSTKHAFTHNFRLSIPREALANREMVFLSCGASSSECSLASADVISTWRQNPAVLPTSPDLLPELLCGAMYEGSLQDWTYLYERYRAEIHSSTRTAVLKALVCTRNQTVMHMLLNKMFLQGEIHKKDVPVIMQSLLERNTACLPYIWTFLKENYQVLMRGRYLHSVITLATTWVRTEEGINEIESFMKSNPYLGNGALALKKAKVKASTNMDWFKTNYDTIRQWLTDIGHNPIVQ